VTPQWLRNSVREGRPLPCGDYAALKELHDQTEESCPDCEDPPDSLPIEPHPQPSVLYFPLALTPTSEKVKSNYAARYACTRASPLVCPNQALAAELGILQQSRELEGKAINALSYERAIAVR
jgi:DNA polymerase mu